MEFCPGAGRGINQQLAAAAFGARAHDHQSQMMVTDGGVRIEAAAVVFHCETGHFATTLHTDADALCLCMAQHIGQRFTDDMQNLSLGG